MNDLYNKIVGNRSTAESLVSKIPGFRGYTEMSGRREADRMMREHVASRFDSLLNRFGTIEKDIVRAPGGLMHMDKSKSIRTRLEVLRRRIATDTPGYSGFLPQTKLGPTNWIMCMPLMKLCCATWTPSGKNSRPYNRR
ncbi:MAG: hypothetical protein HC915_01170 [Anaerolineae bacterium]|nr:hypothetical protein [Anaerolineae bacterium]